MPSTRKPSRANAIERFELDLRGLKLTAALDRLELLLRIGREQGVRSLWVRLDQNMAAGGPALFVPIGRKLVDAWRRGDISGCRPLSAADGGGYHVEYPLSEPLPAAALREHVAEIVE